VRDEEICLRFNQQSELPEELKQTTTATTTTTPNVNTALITFSKKGNFIR
jgi:hypothetical protein